MAEYRLTPATQRDLENIWLYTQQEWGTTQAELYMDTLFSAFARFAQTPLVAASCEHIRAGYRRSRIERHMIYFRVTDYGIAVVRVLHDRMDAVKHL
jgi:toxin ParE1/3/4